jgi:hypothetical protein
MAVVFAIPTAGRFEMVDRCMCAWKARGYRTAIIFERQDLARVRAGRRVMQERHLGYGVSLNRLIATVLAEMSDCTAIVTGGDDTFPVETVDAAELERQFLERFPDTLGVMQPTGDDWCGSYGEDGRRSNEISAQSPWLGRAFCERAYRGSGPYWPGYYHFYADTELQAVAERLEIFWQRPDIADFHNNWKRHGHVRPKHLYEARRRWAADQALFLSRRENGFPGHELSQ